MREEAIVSVDGAVRALLRSCPELQSDWQHVCDVWQTDNGDEIGMYPVIGDLILPVLAELLGETHGDSESDHWDRVLPSDVEGREGLTRRMYEVIDRLAASPVAVIREVIYDELVTEGGYGFPSRGKYVTGEELVRPAGPVLRALIEAKTPP